MRLDLSHIQRWINPGSRVLDLGCGDGEFLQFLRDQRKVRGTGLEIDQSYITAAISRGINVVSGWLAKVRHKMPRQGHYFFYEDFRKAWGRVLPMQRPAPARRRKSAPHTAGTGSVSTADKSDAPR